MDYEAKREKQRQARAKLLLKMQSPAYKANQIKKAKAATQRKIDKMNSPAYKAKRLIQQKAAQERQIKRAKLKAEKAKNLPKINTTKKSSIKGLKGRTATAQEKRLQDKIGAMPCICCFNKGVITDNSGQVQYVSLHHTDGRTKPHAHAKCLSLCQYHHDQKPPENAPLWLFPLHGTGRKPWELENGTQAQLLIQTYDIIGEKQPWTVEVNELEKA